MTRPTKPAHWHSFNHHEEHTDPASFSSSGDVLSGIDIIAGGTWFGINRAGKVALLTNITEPPSHLSSSRGHLVSSFLLHHEHGINVELKELVIELLASETPYSGFNLLLLEPGRENDSGLLRYNAALLSNGGAGGPIMSLPLSTTDSTVCGGVSNGTHDGRDTFTGEILEPEWPKVAKGRQMLSEVLARERSEEDLIEDLFELLRYKVDSPPSSRQEFRRNIMIDAVRTAPAKAPHYFQTDNKELDVEHTYYATRLSTVVLVKRTGEVLFVERDEWVYGVDSLPNLASANTGDDQHERRFHFKIS
ncbi:hypothetical protein M422DRAFT_64180 [Sphaerobolus stellatus SS14]|nr:hypothetical protein M422DRAFT_64180 [Sphaerobolus stellatus SS14]